MFSYKALLTLATAAVTVSANCIHSTSLHRRQVSEEGTVEVSKFGYSDLQGPLNWAALDEANTACATGQVQSPIVIDSSIPKAAEAPVVDFPSVEEAEFENLGTTLETIVSGTTTFAGKQFALQQFHMHTPSEHRINDEYFPLEIHMVHEAEDGALAVIAVPFQLTEDGSTTQLMTSVIQNIDAVREPGTITKTGPLDFSELANAIQTKPLFQYTGSLTTPPCAEGLTFLVMEEPMAIDVRTYNAVKSVIKFNARYTQNKLESTNLIQVASQKAELNCAAVEVPPVSNSAAVELQEHSSQPVVTAPTPVPAEAHGEAPVSEETSHESVTPPAPVPEEASHQTSPPAAPVEHDISAAAHEMKVAASDYMKKMVKRRRAL